MSDRRDVFARLHRPGQPLFLPNAWDFATAATLAQAGFAAIGTTSCGVATAAGQPDATGVARVETVASSSVFSAAIWLSLPRSAAIDSWLAMTVPHSCARTDKRKVS